MLLPNEKDKANEISTLNFSMAQEPKQGIQTSVWTKTANLLNVFALTYGKATIKLLIRFSDNLKQDMRNQ
ncbi:hypothetical protein FUAX_33440 [Fulvitalea axinellae]|uniref:Uncharacterized protein n=1 Tax=Fulvitalea axinellae TaxID=1182444 RepID=A0AAU9CZN1_9BACT|nr:hypothetical protein FUAX_33440 [Fulvitalea axinellae]